MVKDQLIRQTANGANEHAQGIFITKSILRIKEQNDSFVDPIERPFITVAPILVTTHCNTVTRWYWPFGPVRMFFLLL